MASSPSTGRGDSVGPQERTKVPIPRLWRSSKSRDDSCGNLAASPVDGKHRVSHACEPCRQRKTKCSGERPVCKHCQDFQISCFYADGKRDRVKNEMITLKARLEIYETLLEQLRPQVDDTGQRSINKALQGERSANSEAPTHVRIHGGELLASSEVGSECLIGHIKEDPNNVNSPNPTGYMRGSREVSWDQRVTQQLDEETEQDSPRPSEGASIKSGSRQPSFSRRSIKRKSVDSAAVDEEQQFQRAPAYSMDDLFTPPSGPQTDPYLLPDRKVADNLINSYFTTFHPSFPIVSKQLFMEQYNTFFETFFPLGSSKRWLAMLNLKFAIGALYLKLVDSKWQGNNTEHLKYFGRARLLCLDERSLFEVADLQQVQVLGLAGMYLLACNQTNRAWHVVGLALRYAQTLGLNLRKDMRDFDEVEKELRVRMWFALYSIEHILCFMTGRPASIRTKDCSVPLPRLAGEDSAGFESFNSALRQFSETAELTPSLTSASIPRATTRDPSNPPDSCASSHSHSVASNPRTPGQITTEEQSASRLPTAIIYPSASAEACTVISSPSGTHPQSPETQSFSSHHTSSYFLEHTKLNKITADVLSSLYSPDTIKRSWSDIQGIISKLELKIVEWRADLPAIWDFDKTHQSRAFVRERMSLAFQYHNARILINRPCLCRMDYRIPTESSRSRGFNRSAALACIGGARKTVALLPDEPNPVELMAVSPWWCLLHYLVSAGVILMVEISMRAEHNPQQAKGLLSDAKKIVRWLRAISKDNISAERSWAFLAKLLIVAAPKIGGDTLEVEKDLGKADLLSAVERRNIANNHEFESDQRHMGYVQDIFRGLLEDPCPFGNIPIHSHFDNIAGVHNPRSSHSTSPVSLGPDIDLTSETEFNNSNPTPFSISGLISPIIHPSEATTVDRSRIEERTQKRLSRGVSNISMPPPLKFSRPTVSPGGLSKNQKERHHKPIGEQEPTESLELAPITVGSVTLDEEDILSSPDGSSRRGRSREALETVITD